MTCVRVLRDWLNQKGIDLTKSSTSTFLTGEWHPFRTVLKAFFTRHGSRPKTSWQTVLATGLRFPLMPMATICMSLRLGSKTRRYLKKVDGRRIIGKVFHWIQFRDTSATRSAFVQAYKSAKSCFQVSILVNGEVSFHLWQIGTLKVRDAGWQVPCVGKS